MKSVYELVRENRQECINFMKNLETKDENGDAYYNFVRFDEEEDDWCDGEGPVYLQEACPFVTYANDDGEITEYAVIALHLKTHFLEKEPYLALSLVNPYYYKDTMEIPVSWLYGISECYIYEFLMNII